MQGVYPFSMSVGLGETEVALLWAASAETTFSLQTHADLFELDTDPLPWRVTGSYGDDLAYATPRYVRLKRRGELPVGVYQVEVSGSDIAPFTVRVEQTAERLCARPVRVPMPEGPGVHVVTQATDFMPAVTAAESGDVIWIEPGVTVRNVQLKNAAFADKKLTIYGYGATIEKVVTTSGSASGQQLTFVGLRFRSAYTIGHNALGMPRMEDRDNPGFPPAVGANNATASAFYLSSINFRHLIFTDCEFTEAKLGILSGNPTNARPYYRYLISFRHCQVWGLADSFIKLNAHRRFELINSHFGPVLSTEKWYYTNEERTEIALGSQREAATYWGMSEADVRSAGLWHDGAHTDIAQLFADDAPGGEGDAAYPRVVAVGNVVWSPNTATVLDPTKSSWDAFIGTFATVSGSAGLSVGHLTAGYNVVLGDFGNAINIKVTPALHGEVIYNLFGQATGRGIYPTTIGLSSLEVACGNAYGTSYSPGKRAYNTICAGAQPYWPELVGLPEGAGGPEDEDEEPWIVPEERVLMLE